MEKKKKIGATRAVDLIHGLIISEDLAKASLCRAESNESIGSLDASATAGASKYCDDPRVV